VRPCAPEWSGNPGSDGYKCVVYNYTCLLYISALGNYYDN
jgi:hypothetical protein